MSLPSDLLAAFFDPDADDDVIESMLQAIGTEEADETDEIEYEVPVEEEIATEEDEDFEYEIPVEEEVEATEPIPINKATAEEREAEHQRSVQAFMELLKAREVDPFRSWSQIAQELENEPAFQAITSGKEREALFAAISPELAERIRSLRQRGTVEALETWTSLLSSLTDASKLPATWTEFSKRLRRTHPSLLKVLDTKLMEKQYRTHIQVLKDRAVTYNIKVNK